jgi:hypothetical protein
MVSESCAKSSMIVQISIPNDQQAGLKSPSKSDSEAW